MMGPRHVNVRGRVVGSYPGIYDRMFLIAIVSLLLIGLLMVASSSIVISQRQFHQPFHYLAKQMVFLGMGVGLGLIVLRLEIKTWYQTSPLLLLMSVGLLTLVLVPGLGHTVNGSTRWFFLGPVHLQVSELTKFCMVAYLAGYLTRQEEQIRNEMIGFIKPMFVIAVVSCLLLMEPDFGATVIIILTALGMMFMAGVRLWQFLILLFGVTGVVTMIAISSPYRLVRLTTFLNPWATQFDSGYQLTQSLIAFGRGGWLGVGLGESIQKLFYLPEAHTDFLFAVLAEELGLVGVLVVIALYVVLVQRGLAIARRAQSLQNNFAAYFAYGCTFWLGLQALINIGVCSGVLPTKGLTLPLMSYGGSSMLLSCVALAVILRVDYESRRQIFGLKR